MASTALYLLDLAVLVELTRPAGNRRVQTLFREHQRVSAIAAPTAYALLRGVEAVPEGARRTQLAGFAHELVRSGPPVLPFDRDAAVWLSRESPRRVRQGRNWTALEGQQAAIAATQDMVLVTRTPATYAGAQHLRTEDWFRP